MSTNSEVLDAQRALTLAQMQRIDAMSSLRLAEARLELAAGVYQR
jgi:outer membrane protein TolC